MVDAVLKHARCNVENVTSVLSGCVIMCTSGILIGACLHASFNVMYVLYVMCVGMFASVCMCVCFSFRINLIMLRTDQQRDVTLCVCHCAVSCLKHIVSCMLRNGTANQPVWFAMFLN